MLSRGERDVIIVGEVQVCVTIIFQSKKPKHARFRGYLKARPKKAEILESSRSEMWYALSLVDAVRKAKLKIWEGRRFDDMERTLAFSLGVYMTI